MSTVAAERVDARASVPVNGAGDGAVQVPVQVPARVPVPCAARPGTALWHIDGPCCCFVGGPPPEFAPSVRPTAG
ncbi:hypothetical protein GC089_03690 [Cellulomonas sp. JZ18]|uniref:hypothetical protein n=1 Tax=Cellulomonas sp. JZ18 TaxID=2654191 RepID=UPI0012D4583B|nr:hypothetical protein [Cellulomonas sp. JZ18]QGQ18521.1 hypothetical protein GC089_03690 [Cellulomonas sp. JZ18]